ncbi:MAG: phosphatidylinositol kinase, partial [Thiohalomonadales bacterium]
DHAASQLEQLGTKSKFWYRNDYGSMLFKQGRPNTGENWAEKVCCEMCKLLKLPHAHYEFAE